MAIIDTLNKERERFAGKTHEFGLSVGASGSLAGKKWYHCTCNASGSVEPDEQTCRDKWAEHVAYYEAELRDIDIAIAAITEANK